MSAQVPGLDQFRVERKLFGQNVVRHDPTEELVVVLDVPRAAVPVRLAHHGHHAARTDGTPDGPHASGRQDLDVVVVQVGRLDVLAFEERRRTRHGTPRRT